MGATGLSRNAGKNALTNAAAMTNLTGVNIQLTTPTSISMMNSFIIKNADQSFDQYYASMKKRKNLFPANLSSTPGGGAIVTSGQSAP